MLARNAQNALAIVMHEEQMRKMPPTSPLMARPIVKSPCLRYDTKALPPIAEDTQNEVRSSIRFEQPAPAIPSSVSPSPSISPSTISYISKSESSKPKESTGVQPLEQLQFLRSVHKRTMRKKALRECMRTLHCLFVYVLPIGGVVFGISGILLGHFLRIEPLFVGGCLLLIATVGLVIQSCFWNRSLPNKFHSKDIPFNMPPEDSLDTKTPPPSVQEEEEPESSTLPKQKPMKPPAVNYAQFRRLSMALNRATAELSAARRMSSRAGGGSGVLNLARRLTVDPMNFADYGDMRELESGNGWIAGRFPHGVRRGLAWNDTGASRFYVSNYD